MTRQLKVGSTSEAASGTIDPDARKKVAQDQKSNSRVDPDSKAKEVGAVP
jgi:hypothetical protein